MLVIHLLDSIRIRTVFALLTTAVFLFAILSFSLFIEYFIDDYSTSGKNIRTLGIALSIVLTRI